MPDKEENITQGNIVAMCMCCTIGTAMRNCNQCTFRVGSVVKALVTWSKAAIESNNIDELHAMWDKIHPGIWDLAVNGGYMDKLLVTVVVCPVIVCNHCLGGQYANSYCTCISA